MGGIPLPALQIHQQPDLIEQYGKAMQLKQLMAAGQMQQIQLKQAQQQQDDQEKIKALFQQNGGDLDKTIAAAPQAGVTPNTIIALQNHSMQVKTQLATLTKDKLANGKQINDNVNGVLQSVLGASDKPTAYAQARQQMLTNPEMYGITDPSHVPPEQYPGDDALKQQLATHQGADQLFNQEMKRREVAAQEVAAKARQTSAEAAAGKTGPLLPQQIDQLNKTLQDRFQVLNPGQALPDQYTLQPGAKQQDYATIDKALEQVERAQGVQAQRETAAAGRAQAQATQANTRSDKSYQFNSAQLEKVAGPIDQAVQRMGRLKDTLAQNSPQADALVAPELLTVMAGGAGSGLRMNEAEISRIVGGKDKWQQLKSKVDEWQLDPSKPFLITPEQRGQIGKLLDAVGGKLTAKQQAIDQGRQALLNTDDPGQHRKIVANTRSAMTSIDAGPGGGGTSKGPQVGAIEDGYRFKGGDASKPENWEKVNK